MKEHPIIMSAPMVAAILAGQKTQTRRIVSPHNTRRDGRSWRSDRPFDRHDWASAKVDVGPSPAGNPGPYLKVPYPQEETTHRVYPIWRPGDRLWVKERAYIAPKRFGDLDLCNCRDYDDDPRMVGYTVPSEAAEDYGLKPRAAFLMPRWASRLTLEIRSVRVERLHDISDSDAYWEGLSDHFRHDIDGQPWIGVGKAEPRRIQAYRELWESINGKGSWDENPWVWVVTFAVVRS